MPALEKLIVQYAPHPPEYDDDGPYHYYTTPGHPLADLQPLQSHVLPRLTHAELPPFLFLKITLPSLLHVRLHRDECERLNPRIYLKELLPALARCPRLVSLRLVYALPDPAEFKDKSPGAHAITLPAFVQDRPTYISAIMPYIISPSVTSVRVDIYDGLYDEELCDLRGLLRPPSSLHTVLAGVDSVGITNCLSSTVLLCRARGEERLRVASSTLVAEEDLLALGHALRSRTSVTQLWWTWAQGEIYPIASSEVAILHSLLHNLQHITILTIRGDHAEVFLQVLRPREGITAQELVCPHLESLSLNFVWSPLQRGRSGSPLALEEVHGRLVERCAQIESVIGSRASRFGSRLNYLDFDERVDINDDDKTVTFHVLSPDLVSVENPLQELQELVDGLVVFGGIKIRSDSYCVYSSHCALDGH